MCRKMKENLVLQDPSFFVDCQVSCSVVKSSLEIRAEIASFVSCRILFVYSNNPIVDATDIEEVVLDGSMTVALNSHMEICCAKMCGVCISPEQVGAFLF